MCTTTNPNKRLCCVCDAQLHGRSDKVFCNYKCKNKYHASIRKHSKSVSVQTINKLSRNYQILCLLHGQNTEKFCVNKLELIRHGFQFDIISGIESNTFGYKFQVYEFSWYFTKNQNVMIYRDKKQSEIAPYVYKRWERTLKNKSTIN